MRESFRQLLRAIRFERDAFVWMDFNDRASGDALIIIAVTRLALFLGLVGFGNFRALFDFGTLSTFALFMIQALIFWLVYSGVAYAIIRFLFQAEVAFPLVLKISGFAYPTTLLLIAVVQVMSVTSRGGLAIAAILGNIWFFAIVAKGLDHTTEVDLPKGIVAAIGGWAGYLVVTAILNGLPF